MSRLERFVICLLLRTPFVCIGLILDVTGRAYVRIQVVRQKLVEMARVELLPRQGIVGHIVELSCGAFRKFYKVLAGKLGIIHPLILAVVIQVLWLSFEDPLSLQEVVKSETSVLHI